MTRARVLRLPVVASSDTELDCIVCRRRKVDLEIVYGIQGGRAAQGIHTRCLTRAQAFLADSSRLRRGRVLA